MTWVDYVFLKKKNPNNIVLELCFFLKKIKLNFDKIIIDSWID
jgi:hypothetical protein